MYDRIFTIFAAAVAAAAVAFYAPPAKPTPAPIPTIPVASAAPKPQCDAAEDGKCECFDKGGCKCAAGKQCKAASRPLTSEEILVLYFTHQAAIEASQPGTDASMRTCAETWLAQNQKHDPRSPQYVPTPMPDLPPPGDVSHIPAPPAVKAAPIAAPKYTQPQPAKAVVTSPSHPHHITATHVLRWQPSYGPLGRERGGQWVRVPVNQARQYRAPQPTYRTYRSCANGSCR